MSNIIIEGQHVILKNDNKVFAVKVEKFRYLYIFQIIINRRYLVIYEKIQFKKAIINILRIFFIKYNVFYNA